MSVARIFAAVVVVGLGCRGARPDRPMTLDPTIDAACSVTGTARRFEVSCPRMSAERLAPMALPSRTVDRVVTVRGTTRSADVRVERACTVALDARTHFVCSVPAVAAARLAAKLPADQPFVTGVRIALVAGAANASGLRRVDVFTTAKSRRR